ncbi:hypothetical protein, partial [Clostridium sp. Marseille-QA1073]
MFKSRKRENSQVIEIRTNFELKLLEKAKLMEVKSLPTPWTNKVILSGTGIIAGGWDSQDNFFLISDFAYSINNPSTGEMINIIYDIEIINNNLTDDYLRFINPVTREVIDIFGLNAGDGVHISYDGWCLEVIYPWWPRASVVINNVFQPGVSSREYLDDTYMIDTEQLDGWIKCGFSKSGNHFV